jgi:hypothetical protein
VLSGALHFRHRIWYNILSTPKYGVDAAENRDRNKQKEKHNGNQEADTSGREVRRYGGDARKRRAGVEVQEREPR